MTDKKTIEKDELEKVNGGATNPISGECDQSKRDLDRALHLENYGASKMERSKEND